MLDPKLSNEQKNTAIERITTQMEVRNNRKDQILSRYPDDVVEKNYDRIIDNMNRMAEIAKDMGGVVMETETLSESDYADQIAKDKSNMSESKLVEATSTNESLIESMNDVINDKNSTKEEIADAKDIIKKANQNINVGSTILGQTGSYGVMLPVFGKDGNVKSIRVLVNKQKALKDGKLVGTAAHEFVHAVFANTLKSDPQMRKLMGGHIKKILESKNIEFSSEA